MRQNAEHRVTVRFTLNEIDTLTSALRADSWIQEKLSEFIRESALEVARKRLTPPPVDATSSPPSKANRQTKSRSRKV